MKNKHKHDWQFLDYIERPTGKGTESVRFVTVICRNCGKALETKIGIKNNYGK